MPAWPCIAAIMRGQIARCCDEVKDDGLERLVAHADDGAAGAGGGVCAGHPGAAGGLAPTPARRSEEHTSELQSLMRISYAVFCLKKKHINITSNRTVRYRLMLNIK